jgi:hypothetical protein
VLDPWQASFEGAGTKAELRVVNQDLEAPLERGQLKTFYAEASLDSGQSIAFRVIPSTLFKVIDTLAPGLQVKYSTAITGGALSGSREMVSLNLTSPSISSPAFVESYSAVTFDQSDVLIAGQGDLNIPLLINSETSFYAIVTNNTGATISGLVSILGNNRESLVGDFGLSANTEITPSTEMSIYNGIN